MLLNPRDSSFALYFHVLVEVQTSSLTPFSLSRHYTSYILPYSSYTNFKMSQQTKEQKLGVNSSHRQNSGPNHHPRHDEGFGDRPGQARARRSELTTPTSPTPSSIVESVVPLDRPFQPPIPYRPAPGSLASGQRMYTPARTVQGLSISSTL